MTEIDGEWGIKAEGKWPQTLSLRRIYGNHQIPSRTEYAENVRVPSSIYLILPQRLGGTGFLLHGIFIQ